MNTYVETRCLVYDRPQGLHGYLSCAAPGYSLRVLDTVILNAELLFIACRFPAHPDIQRAIIQCQSVDRARAYASQFVAEARPDWAEVQVPVMKWAIHVKLVQHFERFGTLLVQSGNAPIVERSKTDPFWAAVPTQTPGILRGENQRGQLLSALRYELTHSTKDLETVTPPVPGMHLFGQEVRMLTIDEIDHV